MTDWQKVQARTDLVRQSPERAAAQLVDQDQQLANLRQQLTEKDADYDKTLQDQTNTMLEQGKVIMQLGAALNAREAGQWISPQTPPENGKIVQAFTKSGDYRHVYAERRDGHTYWYDARTGLAEMPGQIIAWTPCPAPPAELIEEPLVMPRGGPPAEAFKPYAERLTAELAEKGSQPPPPGAEPSKSRAE